MKVWDPGHSFISGFNMLFSGLACWAFCTEFVILLLCRVGSHINKLSFKFLLSLSLFFFEGIVFEFLSLSCVRLLSYLIT